MFGRKTSHAMDRASGRLNGLVDQGDLDRIEAAAATYSKEPCVYFQVKEFARKIKIDEGGRCIHGTVIVAVIRYGVVKTIMLSEPHYTNYFSDGVYIK